MNKLIIGNTEFELEHHLTLVSQSNPTPYVTIGNTIYVGKAIPNTPKEKPKSFEILAFKCCITKYEGVILDRNSDGSFGEYFVDEDDLLNSPLHEIYSIMRHDVEVFTIDEVTQQGKITRLKISGNSVLVSVLCRDQYEYFLEDLRKKKPKDYEILERYDYGEVPCDGDIAPIKSVKRLSDGEIFSIGDNVERMDDNDTIDAFILNYKGNDMWVSTDVKNGYGSSLECAKKARQPILTTDNGVDVYEGDRVWFVTPSRNYEIEQFDLIKSDPFDELKAYHDIHKYFSTREAADNYVLMNRSCLSVQDIIDAYYLKALEKDNLIELAKKKLNVE